MQGSTHGELTGYEGLLARPRCSMSPTHAETTSRRHAPQRMTRRILAVVLSAASLTFALAGTASAQLPQTRLYAAFPCGGKVGTTFDLTITSGADLDEVDRLSFNHPGISAVQKTKDVNGKPEPIANQFVVTIAEDAPTGVYEMRAGGLYGVSNPRSFAVGRRDEIQESEANNATEQANAVSLNTVINGRANSGADVDYFKFSATAGQRVLVSCQARDLDSRMRVSLELYDTNRRRLGHAQHRFGREPLIDVTIPADGEYILKVYDVVFGGSNEHFYRLALHTGPHVDFVVPPSAQPGTTTEFTVFGRNLPGGSPADAVVDDRPLEKLTVKITAPDNSIALDPSTRLSSLEAGIDGFAYRLQTPQGESNSVVLYYASAPVLMEAEPNSTPETAQKVTVPAEITGQFQAVADIDFFDFEAKSGQVFWIDVFGERLGTTADPYLTVEQITRKEDGSETAKRITAQDDTGTNLGPNYFDTLTDDPTYRFVAPADSTYRLSIRDRYFESRGDLRLQYRLAVRTEQPDFRLVALPVAPMNGQNNNIATAWPIGLRKGDNFSVQVLAFRRDGFDETIEVTTEGLPAGVTCPGATIGPGQTDATLIFTAAEDAQPWFGTVRVVGRSRIDAPNEAKQAADATAAVATAQSELTTSEQLVQQLAATTKSADEARALAEKEAEIAAASETKAKEALQSAVKAVQDAQAKLEVLLKNSQHGLTAASKQAGAVKAASNAEQQNQALAATLNQTAESLAKTAEIVQSAAQTAILGKKLVDNKLAADESLKQAAVVASAAADKHAKAKAAFDDMNAKLVAAQATRDAATQKVATATQAAATAQKAYEAAVRHLTIPARSATIVWNGDQNIKAISRTSSGLGLSVLNEDAPFQVKTDLSRMTAHQSRQILIPVKLLKRDGFDNNVALAFAGLPKNVKGENKQIDKGKSDEMLRLFVANNTPPGSYTVYLQAQGQVSYSRNPKQVERAKATQAEAVKSVAEAAEAVKKAVQARDLAKKQFADTTEALKKAQASVKEAAASQQTAAAELKAATSAQSTTQKASADAAAAAKQATDASQAAQDALATAKNSAAKAQTDLTAAQKAMEQSAADVKLSGDLLASATKAATEIAEAVKAAQANLTAAQTAAKTKPDDAELTKAAMQAEEVLKTATVTSQQAEIRRTMIEKRNTVDQSALKQAEEAVAQATKQAVATAVALKQANETADAAAKAAIAAQAQAEKAAAELKTANQTLETATAKSKKAQDELANAEAAAKAAEANLKSTETAQAQAEAAVKAAEAKSKGAEAAKAAADKVVTAAEKAAKPANINVFPPSTPIIIDVAPAPVKLSVSVAGGGNLKKTETLDIKVAVNRLNGFAGPVTLELPLPPGVAGLSAEPVTIPADQKDAVLKVVASETATEGQLANMVVRANMQFQGEAIVDEPVTIKVAK